MKWIITMLALVIAPALAQMSNTAKPITPDSVCGAKAVGINRATGAIVEDQAPWLYVRRDGYWDNCPPKPAAPASAPSLKPRPCAMPDPLVWSFGDAQCRAIGVDPLAHGAVRAILQAPGYGLTGVFVARCDDGKLAVLTETCQRDSDCVASSYRGSDDGGSTWWTWQGRLRDGAVSEARAEDGRTRPIACVGGRLQLR